MKDKRKDSIPKTIARYSASNIYRHITRAANAFIRPKLLEPELYGFWSLIGTLLFYSSHSHLGSHNTMNYSVPYYDSKGEHDKSIQLKGSVFYGTLYINIIISLSIAIYALIGNMNTMVRLGLLTLSALMIINWLSDFYSIHIHATLNFRLMVAKNYIESTISLLLSAVLLYLFGIYGLYLSIILSSILVIFYLRSKHAIEEHYRFDAKIFLDAVKKGFPILMISFSFALIRTADRLIISFFLGNKMLGFYGIAISLFDFIMHIPGSSRAVLEPKLMQSLGSNTVEEILTAYFFKPLYNTAYLIPLLIGPVFFILPPSVSLLLPKYIPGIMSAQIIAFGVYFLALTYIIRGILIANKWQLGMFYITSVVLVLNVMMSIILIKNGFGIEGVAVSSNIAYFILFISLMVFIFNKYEYKAKEGAALIISLLVPFLIMCVALVVLHNTTHLIIQNIYAAAIFNIFLFYILMLIVIRYARKKYPLLSGLSLKDVI